MSEENELQRWIRATRDAFAEAVTSLGMDAPELGEPGPNAPSAGAGGYIALVGRSEVLQLALCADIADCERLAGTMLGLEGDEEISEGDMIDGVGELLNVIAGLVKRASAEQAPDLQLGLPLFVNGSLVGTSSVQRAFTPFSMGDVNGHLGVLHHVVARRTRSRAA